MKFYFKFIIYLIVAFGFSAAHADQRVDFFRAIEIDYVGAVKDLLAQGFDPNTRNDKGQPALLLAVRSPSPRVAAALLADPRIQIDGANSSGETALMIAAIKGSTEWTAALIGRGAEVNRAGWAPLHYAASGPETAVVGQLIERGAVLDAASPNGSTALMMAAGYGPETSVDLLLARGADARLRNSAGLSAADFARRAGRAGLTARLEKAAQ